MTCVAVIGCGHWGKNLVRNFSQIGALAAICDPDATIADAMSDRFGVPARSVDEVLADRDIDAIAIAAPAELHFSLADNGLRSGKHVYVEKPLALEAAEAERLCELAEQTGRTLMVGHLLQYHPAFLKLKAMVEAGELGRLQYIYSNRLNLGKVRREENILWSFAPHDISMILSLVSAEPVQVEAVGAAYLHDIIADVTTTHLAFANGVRAHIFVSWLHPFKEQKLVVVGEDAMAVFDDGQPWDGKVLVYPHKIHWDNGIPSPVKADPVSVQIAEDEPLKLECQHFVDCVAGAARPRTDGKEGLRVLKVLQAAQASLDEKAAQ